ncbi:MAG: 1,2-phenylacetyl-CoA epoxidase subunit PaaD [Chloroflexota bacterium]
MSPAVAPRIPDEDAVREVLRGVADPEIPAISIVDLGMVERVEVGPDGIEVELLPTFVGCPAQDFIREAVIEALAPLGHRTVVGYNFRRPWTSDRITATGRANLAAIGFAPPAEPADVRCPRCGSGQVIRDSFFGPTQCRSLWYCRGCHQPFEAFKPI